MAEIKGNLNVKKNATIDGMLVTNGNIADNASTPKLSIDPNNRILYASDGTTEIIDWSKTGIASAKVSGGENLISLNDLAFFTNFDGAFNFVSGAYQEEGSWKNLGNGYAIITANDPYVGYGTTCIQGSADSGDDTQTFQLITFPDGRFTIGLVGDTTGEIGTITGDVSGNINIMGVINDDSDGMSIDPNNRILYADDGTTSRLDWSGTGVAVGGKISNYNNINTVSNGVPSEYATVDLTTQGAAIGTTTLYAVPASGAGMYRVSYSAKVTRAASTSSVLGALTIGYTDPDATTPTIVSATNNGNTTTSLIQGVMIVNAKESTNITYAMDYTSDGATTMQYNLKIKCEAM